MNLKDIANLANVSVSTVSKAFSGSREISDKTKKHIFEIAREKGCFDRYNKNKFDKKLVAVIVPEVNSDYYYRIVLELDREITRQGGVLLTSISNFSEDKTAELFSYYSEYCKVDGIVIIDDIGKVKNPLYIPTVAMCTHKKIKNIDTMCPNIQPALNQAILHLRNLGHTKIGFVGEKLTTGRLNNFKEAMTQAGAVLNPEYIKISNKRFEEAGFEIAEEMIAKNNLPSAIIAAYDYIAIGFIKALRKHGYQVPQDVSVIGIDDIGLSKYLETSLSSISINNTKYCRLITDMLFKKMKNQYIMFNKNDMEINAELKIRDSIGPPKKTD